MHLNSGCDTRGEVGRPSNLILDPDSRIAEALALARPQRAEVEWVSTGVAGLLLSTERRVDLPVTHVHLADLACGDLLRLLTLLRPGIRVAILGADPPPKGCLESEGITYLPQPFQLKRLLAWLDGCLDGPPLL